MEYYHFDPSITELYLCNKNITSMKQITNLHELINLKTLCLFYNNITKIEGLENLTNLQGLVLAYNKISIIEGLNNLTNLKVLNLSYNKISKIEGLDNFTYLTELHLSGNKISIIEGIEHLNNLQKLDLYNNQINIIEELGHLTNLIKLVLSNNKINIIEGLDNLSNLQELHLYDNRIIIIKGLDNLTNLQYLNLNDNQITIIEKLDNLTNLKVLYISENKITNIEGLANLNNLQKLYIYNNNITELPLSLCNLRHIKYFTYHDNPIEYIPLPVQRWLDRLNNRVTDNNMIYNDRQNIHNHHIQNSFQKSLSNILKDKNILELDFIKQHIVDNDILTQETKESLITYIDSPVEHSTYLINYGDLLRYVYTRIINSDNKDNLLSILNSEVGDSLCMCFTGRMTRLLNVLTGFYNDIEIQISDSEQITNIIMSLKKRVHTNELKEAVKQELTERQFSETVINEWLEYI